jgi:cellulose synthase/poly-beta-1,6-N-acetylglucosamine synthase-like glycosyltransferase
VIPGPCGLFRTDFTTPDAINFYVGNTSLPPEQSGMLLGSLLLAEDRVYSYAAIIRASNTTNPSTAYIPDAVFKFEAETDPEHLLTQRRRWINGKMSIYISDARAF